MDYAIGTRPGPWIDYRGDHFPYTIDLCCFKSARAAFPVGPLPRRLCVATLRYWHPPTVPVTLKRYDGTVLRFEFDYVNETDNAFLEYKDHCIYARKGLVNVEHIGLNE